MTLVFRLAVLILAGLTIAVLTYFLLWPTSTPRSEARIAHPSDVQFSVARLAGQYTAKSKAGSYRLALAEDGTATLDFTDRKGKHFGYRGELVEGRITWHQSLNGKKWVDLERPVDDVYTTDLPSTIITREGRFHRIQK